MSHGSNSMSSRRAFSLVEVLIAIVVLALGLLGIAAVFPAVVSQQRSTTDAVQGIALTKSIETLLKSHYGANRQSQVPSDPNDPLFGLGIVDARQLKGWASLTGIPEWSQAQEVIDHCGLWSIPQATAQLPGIMINRANGTVLVMGTTSNLRPPADGNYPTPGFVMDEEGRLIGHRPVGSNGTQRGEYIFDFAARRIGAGRAFLYTGTANEQARTCQDDQIELAVFIRRVDRPASVPGAGVAVGEDAQRRPTYNGTGTYSPIRSAAFTISTNAIQADLALSNEQLVTLAPDQTTDVRFMRQLGQKFVSPWGSVHTVTDYGEEAADVVIRPILDPGSVTKYGSVEPLEFLYTLQVPVAVDVVRIAPKIVK